MRNTLIALAMCTFAVTEATADPRRGHAHRSEAAYYGQQCPAAVQVLPAGYHHEYVSRKNPAKGYRPYSYGRPGPPPWAPAHGYRAKKGGYHPGSYVCHCRPAGPPYRHGGYGRPHPAPYPPSGPPPRGRYPRGRAGGYIEIYF